MSARSLSRSDFASQVAELLVETGVEPRHLIIEITETARMVDPIRAERILTELHHAGVRVSLDDFGCGQTSLGYLATLPVNELKIDRTFIADMLVNPAHAAIGASDRKAARQASSSRALLKVGLGRITASTLARSGE